MHLIQTWPKPAGLSMLPLVEEKPTAGGCQEFFSSYSAITSTGCYKYWQALKIIGGAATSQHLPALLQQPQPISGQGKAIIILCQNYETVNWSSKWSGE